MADENKNENEEADDFFGDDEDFGLPDLEYEALDEDDSKGDEPLSEEVTADEPAAAAEDATDASDPFGDDFDVPDDLGEPEAAAESTESDEGLTLGADDASASADADAGASDASGDSGDDFYSEETFEDFDAGDLGEDLPDSVFDSDVLDDDEFKDFESEFAETEKEFGSETTSSYAAQDTSASKGKFTKIVVLGTILFVGLGFGFWYAYNNFFGEESKEVAKKEAPKKRPAKKPAAKAQKPANSGGQEASKQQAASGNTGSRPQNQRPASNNRPANTQQTQAKPAQAVAADPGAINKIDSRTGNAFVIIGSFVDEDIANDFATKLASEGKSPSIISPFGNGLFHRVAIAGYPTIAAAQQSIDNLKAEYGEDIWVLKY